MIIALLAMIAATTVTGMITLAQRSRNRAAFRNRGESRTAATRSGSEASTPLHERGPRDRWQTSRLC